MKETNSNQIQPRLLRMKDLVRYVGLSRAFLYSEINLGKFPAGTLISAGVRVWPRELVDQWIDRRLDGTA